ncbi:MAG: cytochrome c3 family protein [Calditrichaeota bacterium]|nr:cytochrome c3 family protein [Calditrichota bacterium]MCB9391903.1 cytochrome c3 family protein [Calditrichota bacterium]
MISAIRRLFEVCILLWGVQAFAQLSPGDLSKHHAGLEGLNNCTQCHELRKEVNSKLCLTCHTAIEQRITASKGYHSSTEVKTSACAKCHPEHFGRDFEIVHWKDGKEKFDHAATGWELIGAHSRAGCRQCHIEALIADKQILSDKNLSRERTYLGLGTACLDCHADEHVGQLGTNCAQCHTQEAWKPAQNFSHDSTSYPLTGKHFEAQCAKCHEAIGTPALGAKGKIEKRENSGIYAKYKGLKFENCTPCHRDVHENRFGADCASCHNTSGFDQIADRNFDHAKTGYPLAGKHIAVACAKCHISGKNTDPVAHAACADCHKDTHKGQFTDRAGGSACEACHTVEGFLPARYSIQDHEQSRYPLTGSHLAVPCFVCHAQIMDTKGNSYAQFDFADQSCKGCHEDIHRGQLDKFIGESGCEFCHNTETWHKVTFDHAKTKFPLIGKHESTECMGCHIIENPGTDVELMRMSPLAQECALCHKDPHAGQFLSEGVQELSCKPCHTPADWKQLLFDHNRDAKWALDGAHAKVACSKCHPRAENPDGTSHVRYKPLSSACSDCHAGTPQEQE